MSQYLKVNQVNEFKASLIALGYTESEAIDMIVEAVPRAAFCIENATDYEDAMEILEHSLQYETYILNSDMLDVAADIIWLFMEE
jgi:predicted metal-dependent TIM-barrel fold hydrolase